MAADDRYRRGRDRFLEVHDEKALRAVEGLGDLGRSIIEFVYGDIYLRPGQARRALEPSAVAWRVGGGCATVVAPRMRRGSAAAVSVGELREVILQTSAIAGVPPAMNAWSTLKTIHADEAS
jgi:alkylhydroperoxidase/carboxymuconolactone decarboxylase family protein YurZ